MKREASRPKILVVSYEYPPLGGGGAKVVDGLVEKLVHDGMAVDIVTMGFRGLRWREVDGHRRVIRIPGIRRDHSVCQPHEMVPYLLLAFPVVMWLVLRNKYLINHTHFILPDGLLSAMVKLFTRLPVVATAHGSDVPGYNPNRFRLLHRILRPVWRWLTSYIDTIICPSKFLRDLIKWHNPEARTTLIANGIDLKRFDHRAPKAARILCVTRMFERKGVQHLVRAVASRELPGWKTSIVGDGPYLDTLREMAPADRDIEFLGYLDNNGGRLKELYESASIFVLASSSENFPIVLLEAMIAGAAIITTSGTGCQDVVGDAALLVPRNDPEQLADALELLVNDEALRELLGRKARRRAESNFSWQVVADQHRELYATHGRRADLLHAVTRQEL
jgi:glycosyltransferase involved in cell wall biosynthesis